ncbi:uncharacterized protein BDZ83DRAFT_733202 [Colletotrichum acutatum]|uniref:Uncharacterized protein n=1 Tax=Glomerella acutata TaxID=27357 RepID=A0AAD8UEW0_GLOAC|nr:uncharacterized protein BDZ83DRAFT_733202 [Colletotrichum acutatum]KAK1720186.1 hypothetical protein BDZ83DRAFT_733202 [Colletotrichum acutatum]
MSSSWLWNGARHRAGRKGEKGKEGGGGSHFREVTLLSPCRHLKQVQCGSRSKFRITSTNQSWHRDLDSEKGQFQSVEDFRKVFSDHVLARCEPSLEGANALACLVAVKTGVSKRLPTMIEVLLLKGIFWAFGSKELENKSDECLEVICRRQVTTFT